MSCKTTLCKWLAHIHMWIVTPILGAPECAWTRRCMRPPVWDLCLCRPVNGCIILSDLWAVPLTRRVYDIVETFASNSYKVFIWFITPTFNNKLYPDWCAHVLFISTHSVSFILRLLCGRFERQTYQISLAKFCNFLFHACDQRWPGARSSASAHSAQIAFATSLDASVSILIANLVQTHIHTHSVSERLRITHKHTFGTGGNTYRTHARTSVVPAHC